MRHNVIGMSCTLKPMLVSYSGKEHRFIRDRTETRTEPEQKPGQRPGQTPGENQDRDQDRDQDRSILPKSNLL